MSRPLHVRAIRVAGQALRTVGRDARSTARGIAARAAVRLDPDIVVGYWWRRHRNFGDEFTPLLVREMHGRTPVHVDDLPAGFSGRLLMGVGSILQQRADDRMVVWGSGLIAPDREMKAPPASVHAVRGPLTRRALLQQGLECPRVFGDPALLYPRFHSPRRPARRYGLGIIPHLVDRDHGEVRRFRDDAGARIIDVQRHPHAVIADVLSCRAIASSSLHGLIVAIAYGVPAVWVDFSGKVMGGGFKFRDFFASIHADAPAPLVVTSETTPGEILDSVRTWALDLDLDQLAGSFPFSAA